MKRVSFRVVVALIKCTLLFGVLLVPRLQSSRFTTKNDLLRSVLFRYTNLDLCTRARERRYRMSWKESQTKVSQAVGRQGAGVCRLTIRHVIGGFLGVSFCV